MMKPLVIALSLLVSGAASAQKLPASLARIDQDRDGKVSAAEWAADRDAIFAKIDKNKDGSIDRTEIIARYSKPGTAVDDKMEDRIARLMAGDLDRDGKLTRAESQQVDAAEFKRRDRNGDGFIAADDSK